jgi:hypothetical protein
MPARPQAALLVFALNPRRIGGIEVHTPEVVAQLAERGCLAVLCFPAAPSPAVLQYLSLPNVRWEKMSQPGDISVVTGTAFLFETSGIHGQSWPILEPRHAVFYNYHDPSIPLQEEISPAGGIIRSC